MQRIETAVGFLCRLLLWVGAAAVALMMLHITADIVGKSLLHRPIHGTLEITTYYYMPVVALAPLAAVQFNREHIMVELFTTGFGPRLIAALDAFMALLIALFFGLIAWFSLSEAISKTLRNDFVYVVFFDLRTWPARWVVPTVCAIVVLTACLQAIVLFSRALRPARPAEGA